MTLKRKRENGENSTESVIGITIAGNGARI